MTAQLRSELIKMRTTRAIWLLALAAAAITAFGALVEGVSPSAAKLGEEVSQRTMFGANITAVLLATIAGIVTVTGEFRYGTIRPTLILEPRRRVVIGAKLGGAALTGVLLALVCTAVAFGTGGLILAIRGVDFTVSGGHLRELALGTGAASALGGMIGVALGALIRNQVTVIVALLTYAVAIDAALFGAAPAVGRYLPGKASDALAGRAVDHLLTPGAGGAVFLLWTVVIVVAALVHTEHADVDVG